MVWIYKRNIKSRNISSFNPFLEDIGISTMFASFHLELILYLNIN